MKAKTLIISAVAALVLVNGSIFGTLFAVEYLREPTPEEIAAAKAAELKAAQDAIYASLPPLDTTSKVNYIRSMGEAIGFCEERLNATVKVGKSWDVNMIESRYVEATHMYLIFLTYHTLTTKDKPAEDFDVICEVSAEKRAIEVWKVMAAES